MLIGTGQDALIRLFFALISGAVIGYERSNKRRDAGFRTHIIVCMSSCAIMITNIHMFMYYGAGDPVRMPAQVISGVGFLGAGCILVTGQHRIKGVTTAAGIWSAACLGVCIGAGDYIVGFFVLAMLFLTMSVFKAVDKRIATTSKHMLLYVELESASGVTDLIKHLRSKEMKVDEIEFLDSKQGNTIAAVLNLELEKPEPVDSVISALEAEKGVVYASDL